MFSGIVECVGIATSLKYEQSNLKLTIKSPISSECYIDQSISHDGVCLTVINHNKDWHQVVAVKETLERTSLQDLREGSELNLERSIKISQRLDGHLVQGHIDTLGKCIAIEELDGSWYFEFQYERKYKNLLVDKGSIAVNGISLTIIEPSQTSFRVAIIPYTMENTNFKTLETGGIVNLEFDIVGKYVARNLENY